MADHFASYKVEDRSYVAWVKREIHSAVAKAGFAERRIGEIDIIVSELLSNLIKYGGGGEVLFRISIIDKTPVFEILCIDSGPGIADISRVMKDGMSSSTSLGQGLGSVKRLSDLFNIYSVPMWGTIAYSRVGKLKEDQANHPSPQVNIRAFLVCKPREESCGDGFRIKEYRGGVKIFFGDGLGHGEQAHLAVKTAGDFFYESNEENPVDILRMIHEKVRRTRGLVATVATIDFKEGVIKLCGIGNILTRFQTGIVYKNYMSYNGTIGLNIPTSMKESIFPFEKNQQLIMTSDGIRTRWDLSKYGSIMKNDGMITAAAIYKDFTRGNDDSSVLLAKIT